MTWDWLTASIAPWWATAGLPIVTLALGTRGSRKAAKEQREDDSGDREKEREHNLRVVKEQLAGERLAAQEARGAQQAADERAGISETFKSALDAMGALEAGLARSGLDGDAATPLDPVVLAAFLSTVNAVRLYVGDDDLVSTPPSEMTMYRGTTLNEALSAYIYTWHEDDGDRVFGAQDLALWVRTLADQVAELHRLRFAR